MHFRSASFVSHIGQVWEFEVASSQLTASCGSRDHRGVRTRWPRRRPGLPFVPAHPIRETQRQNYMSTEVCLTPRSFLRGGIWFSAFAHFPGDRHRLLVKSLRWKICGAACEMPRNGKYTRKLQLISQNKFILLAKVLLHARRGFLLAVFNKTVSKNTCNIFKVRLDWCKF